MPRPNLKEQRSREILDAFVSCVARFGLEGATQESIAAVAGVKRTLLRHYLGNRNNMISALVNHVVEKFDALTKALQTSLQQHGSIDILLNTLFAADRDNAPDTELTLVFQALVAASDDYTIAKKPLLNCMTRFVRLVDQELMRVYPNQTDADRKAIAHGIVGIYLMHDSLAPLRPPAAWRNASHRAAKLLIKNLEVSTQER